MNIIKPECLKLGDTIGFLSTSGYVEDESRIYKAKDFFEKQGFNVVLSEGIFDKKRYLAGSDEKKIEELHKFFAASEIKAIICARGGYGALRLIDKIDYELIRRNPKIFCGYSDVTALSLMMYKRAGLITYSAPMVYGDFGEDVISDFTANEFFKVVFSGGKHIYKGTDIYRNGSAEGILWGGNLSTVVSLCGLDFIPDEKFIFFAEDLNEPVYKIDKMFTQLINIDKFRENLQAVVLGDFLDVDNQAWLKELFIEISQRLNVPVVAGFPITHAKNKTTMPVGQWASLNETILEI